MLVDADGATHPSKEPPWDVDSDVMDARLDGCAPLRLIAFLCPTVSLCVPLLVSVSHFQSLFPTVSLCVLLSVSVSRC